MTAEEQHGDSQQCCTDRRKVYLNSGKHVDASYEVHDHAGTWSTKSSQFLSFLLQNVNFPEVLGLSPPHALKVLHDPKIGKTQLPIEKLPSFSS